MTLLSNGHVLIIEVVGIIFTEFISGMSEHLVFVL